jgi:hypothetical protein
MWMMQYYYFLASGVSEQCTRAVHRSLLLLGLASISGEVDGVHIMTAWSVWWIITVGTTSPTCMGFGGDRGTTRWPVDRVGSALALACPFFI